MDLKSQVILQKRLWNVPNPFNNTRCRFANDEWVAWKHDINDLFLAGD